MGETNMETILSEIDSEIELMQTDLISDKDFEKIQNIIENRFVSSNSTVAELEILLHITTFSMIAQII